MTETKQKALLKLEKELAQEPNDMEQMIAEWLKKQTDDELFKGMIEEQKSIKNARQYAYNEAHKHQVGGCAIIKDETVFEWVSTYYKTPMIVATDNKLEKESKPSPKKEKAKVRCLNSVKKKNTPPITTEPKGKMMEGEQLDLLSFL